MNPRVIALALSASLAACGFDEPPPAPPAAPPEMIPEEPQPPPMPPPPATAMDRLARGMSIALQPDASAISVVVAKTGEHGDPQLVAATHGTMSVRISDNAITSAGLSVELADIFISKDAFPPSGLQITNISASMSFDGLHTVWADHQAASFDGASNVHVTWSLVTKDGLLPLRALDVPHVPVSGEIEVTADDRVTLDVSGLAPGVLLDVAGVAQLSDLSVALKLEEPAPAHP